MKLDEAFFSSLSDELKQHYLLSEEDTANAVPHSSPAVAQTVDALAGLIELMLPARRLKHCQSGARFLEELRDELSRIAELLEAPLEVALRYRWLAAAERGSREVLSNAQVEKEVEETLKSFFLRLPAIRAQVVKDIEAAYRGDPAALSYVEVSLSYPGLLAIVSHRLAHELYLLEVPILPRLMSEWTHGKSGVDIHPGARIGESFFIDHATGVVIGETTRIGANVKIYQGVTLGAKSFPLDEDGNPVKHIQRHPTVGDNVVIYANATILGGDTLIGANSTIGGNVFLTESVPENSLVFRNERGPEIRNKAP